MFGNNDLRLSDPAVVLQGQVQLSPRATPGAFDDDGQRLGPLQPAVLYLRQGERRRRAWESQLFSGYVKIAIEKGHRNSGFSH